MQAVARHFCRIRGLINSAASIFQKLPRCRDSGHNDSVTGHGSNANKRPCHSGLAPDALRALDAGPFTVQPEIGSGLLEGGAGWRLSGGHESDWVASMFVTRKSIGKFRRNATRKTFS
jgi:hypothetical protein